MVVHSGVICPKSVYNCSINDQFSINVRANQQRSDRTSKPCLIPCRPPCVSKSGLNHQNMDFAPYRLWCWNFNIVVEWWRFYLIIHHSHYKKKIYSRINSRSRWPAVFLVLFGSNPQDLLSTIKLLKREVNVCPNSLREELRHKLQTDRQPCKW